MDILGQEFAHLTDIKNFDLFHDTVTDFLVREGVIFLNDGQIGLIQENLVTLHDCAAILHDYIESYYCLLSTVLGMKGGMAKKDLLALTRKNSVKLYHLEEIKCAESLSMANYTNAVQMLLSKGLVTEATAKRNHLLAITSMPGLMKLREILAKYMFLLNRPIMRMPESRSMDEKEVQAS
jgi:glycerol-3-phosphate O-acyltransferase